jgi:hypothetical protein
MGHWADTIVIDSVRVSITVRKKRANNSWLDIGATCLGQWGATSIGPNVGVNIVFLQD